MNPSSAMRWLRLSPGTADGPGHRDPGLWPAVREWFAYHGIWAPGVRLLRNVSIHAKVLLIVALLLVPLVPLAVHLLTERSQTALLSRQYVAALQVAQTALQATARLGAAPSADAAAAGPARLATLRQALETMAQTGVPAHPQLDRLMQTVADAVGAEAPADSAGAQRRLDAEQALRAVHDHALEHGGLRTLRADPDRARGQLVAEVLPALLNELIAAERRLQTPEGDRPARAAAWAAHAGALQLLQNQQDTERRHLPAPGGDAPSGPSPLVRAITALQAAAIQDGATSGLATVLKAAREDAQAQRDGLMRDLLQAQLQVQADAEFQARLAWIGVLTAAGMAGYLIYAFFLVLDGGLRVINLQVQRLADGDISTRPQPLGRDEVGQTMQAFTRSLVRLSDLLGAVRQSVAALQHASTQVAAGNGDLAARNRHNDEALAQLVQGVTQYAAQLQACGAQVEQVVAAVQALRLESTRSRKHMGRMAERMDTLRIKSREIGEIVSLIDAIAFRTNILALNASVEASKAGESGRGFAVVAQEVRSLALRSAQSAQRIGEIAARSAEDIETSGVLASEAGSSLESLDGHVDHIHRAMETVADLTRNSERDSGLICAQVGELKQAATKDLQLVAQLEAASSALRSQGEQLGARIAQFKLG